VGGGEIERIQRAGRAGAIRRAYRAHTIAMPWCGTFAAQNPFVIASSPPGASARQDLIATCGDRQPLTDDIAAARVLAPRRGGWRRPIWYVLRNAPEEPQENLRRTTNQAGELPFEPSANELSELSILIRAA